MPHHVRLYLYLFVSMLAVAPLIGCDQSDRRTRERGKDEEARKERIAEEKTARRDLILALMKTHSGNDVWEQSLNVNTWTADLQERLSGQTIVSAAVLIDVWLEQDNKHQLHLIKEVSLDRKIEFFLSCQKPDTLPQNLTDLPEYVFAAKVHSVRKDQSTPLNSSTQKLSELLEQPSDFDCARLESAVSLRDRAVVGQSRQRVHYFILSS